MVARESGSRNHLGFWYVGSIRDPSNSCMANIGVTMASPGAGSVTGVAAAKAQSRTALIEELWIRHGGESSRATWRYRRKRMMWRVVVKAAAAAKRAIDIIAAASGLLVLSPLFLLIALCIKLTDRGPALY